MGFVLRMVGREARASWRRLLFFFLCVAVGVGAIVALRSVIQSVRGGARGRGAHADRGRHHGVDQPPVDPGAARRRSSSGSARAAPRPSPRPSRPRRWPGPPTRRRPLVRAIELQGVERGLPLLRPRGTRGRAAVRARPAEGPGRAGAPGAADAARPARWATEIVIGDLTFTIRGVVLSEPGRRLGFFSFGPRVLVDLADLERTGLLAFGSRARRDAHGAGAPGGGRSARRGAAQGASRSSSSARAPSAAARTSWARTSIARRTTSAWSASSSSSSAASACGASRACSSSRSCARIAVLKCLGASTRAGAVGLRRAGAGARARSAARWACVIAWAGAGGDPGARRPRLWAAPCPG